MLTSYSFVPTSSLYLLFLLKPRNGNAPIGNFLYSLYTERAFYSGIPHIVLEGPLYDKLPIE